MPIVMKSSDNGMVDAESRTVRLPDYLRPRSRAGDAMRAAAVAAAPLLWMSMSSLPVHADTVTISDGVPTGATATINTQTTNSMDSSVTPGLVSLEISNGMTLLQQVQQQTFYYRLGNSGAATPLSNTSSSTLSITQSEPVAVSPDDTSATVTYNGLYTPVGGGSSSFTVSVQYDISAGTDSAVLSEFVQIDNLSSSTLHLPISLFQYNDFVLNGIHNADTVTIAPPGYDTNTAFQTNMTSADSNLQATVSTLPESDPDYYQAALTSDSDNILGELSSGTFTHLNDNATASYMDGPGDATWAFEWDPYLANSGPGLAPGQSFQLSEEIDISVPEPATAGMMILGLGGLMGTWRGRRRST